MCGYLCFCSFACRFQLCPAFWWPYIHFWSFLSMRLYLLNMQTCLTLFFCVHVSVMWWCDCIHVNVIVDIRFCTNMCRHLCFSSFLRTCSSFCIFERRPSHTQLFFFVCARVYFCSSKEVDRCRFITVSLWFCILTSFTSLVCMCLFLFICVDEFVSTCFSWQKKDTKEEGLENKNEKTEERYDGRRPKGTRPKDRRKIRRMKKDHEYWDRAANGTGKELLNVEVQRAA